MPFVSSTSSDPGPSSFLLGLTINRARGADLDLAHAGPGGHVQRRQVQAGQGVQGAQQRNPGLRLQERTDNSVARGYLQSRLIIFQTFVSIGSVNRMCTGYGIWG